MARNCWPILAWTSRPSRASGLGELAGAPMESRFSGLSEAGLSEESGSTASRLVLRCFISPFFPRSPMTKPPWLRASPVDCRPTPVFAYCSPVRELFWNFFCRTTFFSVSLGNAEGEGVVPTSQAVLQHLPFLRRYARALTGSQASGDAYVAATLEALVKDPDLLESSYPPRVTLFQFFSTIWNSLPANETTDPAASLVAPERHLSQITAKPRQAF